MKTELIGVRIPLEVVEFLRKSANKKRRTLSGVINLYLQDQMNREQNWERKENYGITNRRNRNNRPNIIL